ncbi:MAG: type IV secretion system DNA-binding domain-containing protein [Armatimonadetes bacterium]|nr:type IV secretion system DNA-binding domain-containing protein [Armatimonadota bacterium]
MRADCHEDNSITPFGVTDYRDTRLRFGIKRKDRRGHMYVIGQTGTGKSTLIENMAISDILRGEGLALIDPHGDLAESLLDSVPEKRLEDVIYFNAADSEYPVGINPLDKVNADLRSLVASGLISVFKKIWPDFWGPRLEHILRYSLLTLLERPDSTLQDVPPLLTDKGFRTKVLKSVTDRQVHSFWLLEFDKYTAWLKSEAVSPVLNKMGQFLASVPIRNIVGQSRSSFKLRQVMDEGKILIVRLAKGRIGEDNCALLGALIVTRIMLAALSRSDIPEGERRPFYLYVDEVHNFFTDSFIDMLSESRKYGLCLVLAHQYIDQLDEKMRSAIFGNVGTIVSFRVGMTDARVLAQQFEPVFDGADLIGLPNHHIYLKLMIDGVTSRPFSAKTLPPAAGAHSWRKEITEFSRAKYGRPRQEVERQLIRR